ncbi:MAG: hypothetical protein A3D31_10305 [Candidatus Fluviicola riflensis]|nr:MAG: hypothetical protein CHH17_14725 [Candidatus Fluviicola riflensis]OGS77395.1 MAG: hypothetical protein A3D31_10305 [Candidatus Fluviicola riflensis]OGS83975.1 MAG: hypothetical protein A3E30_11705 [Fluviicola sp. RIFCSPHIGHO2_12_FULL_43_24]OGS84462.1 MAG: hypothetical protein A2724_07245 [Fluviicola sp. RIFCSPHIGHO2_01_FULL_43_53]
MSNFNQAILTALWKLTYEIKKDKSSVFDKKNNVCLQFNISGINKQAFCRIKKAKLIKAFVGSQRTQQKPK